MISQENLRLISLDDLPKKFCEQAYGGFNKDTFIFALISGNKLETYATTPQIMKSIAEWMLSRVVDYEKQFGKIDTAPSPIQSPFQVDDLKK